jgi:hypothetical protein
VGTAGLDFGSEGRLASYAIGRGDLLYSFDGDLALPQPFELWEGYGPGPHLKEGPEPLYSWKRWAGHATSIWEDVEPPADAHWVVAYDVGSCSVRLPMSLVIENLLRSFQSSGRNLEGSMRPEEGRDAIWFADAAVGIKHDPQPTEAYVLTHPRGIEGALAYVPGREVPVRTAICLESHWSIDSDLIWDVEKLESFGDVFRAAAQGIVGGVAELFNIGECPKDRHMNVRFCGDLFAHVDGRLGFNVWPERTKVKVQDWPRINFICNNEIKPKIEQSFRDAVHETVAASAATASANALIELIPSPIRRVFCTPDSCFVVFAESVSDESYPALRRDGFCDRFLDLGVDGTALSQLPVMTDADL